MPGNLGVQPTPRTQLEPTNSTGRPLSCRDSRSTCQPSFAPLPPPAHEVRPTATPLASVGVVREEVPVADGRMAELQPSS